MQFDGRQAQLLGDDVVLDGLRVVHRLSTDHSVASEEDAIAGTTTERLELGLDDLAVLVDLENNCGFKFRTLRRRRQTVSSS